MGNGRRALALVALDPEGIGAAICKSIAERLAGTPGNITEPFTSNPLFRTQGLLETGFELQAADVYAGQNLADCRPGIAIFTLKGMVSRKTLMPFVIDALP